MSGWSESIDREFSKIVSEYMVKSNQALDEVVTLYKQKHGRWPAFAWVELQGATGEAELSMTFVAKCGDERPDVGAVYNIGHLNDIEIDGDN